MWKKITAIILILVISAGILFIGNPLAPAFKASAATYRSGFSITPEKEDETGVSLDSGFILSSQTEVTLDYVKANATMRNGGALDVTKTKDGNYLLKPSEPLKQNKVNFIDVKTQAGNIVSFAFQTTRDFTVLGSLPENMSTNVPLDTGIELYFSYPDVKNISKYFEISPKVDGRFESNGYTTVFIPKGLKAGTLYTVTIKKGLSSSEGAAALKENYTFSFETSPDQNSTADPIPGSLYLSNNWFEFGSTEKPAIPFDIYINGNPSSADVTLKVYQFKSADDFVKAVREKEKAPSWAYYTNSKNMIDTGKLNKVLEFKQNFNLSKWQNKFMMFPEILKDGYYVVELSYDKLSSQAFLQITDILPYSVSDKDNTLFWLNDIKTGEVVKNAEILNLQNSGTGVKTDDSGLAKLPVIKKTGNGTAMTQDLYKVTTGDGKSSIINAGYSYDADYKFYYRPYNEGLYWRYMQTDRTLYKPNDTVEFWGFIKSRIDGASPDKVTVELANGGYYYPMRASIGRFLPFLSNPLETMTLETKNGFYDGNMRLPALDPGSYTITVKDGDEVLSSTYFTVENYVKPQYKLEITSDKKAVFVGEKITFTLRAAFFDGTPVANVPLNYNINTYTGSERKQGVTDINGVLKVEYTPVYGNTMQGEAYFGIQVSAQFPETGEIFEYYNFRVFANDITFASKGEIKDNKAIIDITANKVDLGTLNDEDLTNDNYTGEPVAAHNFKVTLTHITWNKVEIGDEYDAINKVVRKRYEYRETKKIVDSRTLITDKDGKAHYEFPANSSEEGYYTARITTDDNNGRSMNNEVWLYNNGIMKPIPYNYEYYTLKADKEKYKANETVTVQVMKNETEPLKNMRTLFVKARNGIQNYQVNSQPTLSEPFLGEMAPNYYLQGVVFNGKSYIQTECNIVYDYDEKKLNLDIKTDKASYKPGENMTITVIATDINGKPVSSKVNLSLVDEALLKLSGQYIDPLAQLYSWIDSGLIRNYSYGRGRMVYGGAMENGAAYDMAASKPMEAPMPMPSSAPAMRNQSKAEMADASVMVRSEFKDTALFKTIELDDKGSGTYTFKLPDNITSFSLAAAAVSKDLYAGSEIQSTKVSMPFFINDALSLSYLVGDKPYVGLTAYGEGLAENEKVDFEITIKELPSFKQTASAKAFERVNLPLPTMVEGTYTIVMTAKSETGKSDSISRTINVYPSYRTIETASLKSLTAGMKLDAGKSGLTTLIFTDAGRGSLINSLHALSWDYGKRLDQKLVSNYARSLLQEVVKNENYWIEPIEVNPSDYKNEDGGYGILPYAGSDMKFTALITPLLKNETDVNSLKAYFYNALLTEKEVQASSIYALAVLGEPVLLDLNKAAQIDNLSLEDYLFLGMAYESLGDLSAANDIYQGRIVPNLEKKDPYVRVKTKNNDLDVQYKLTALTAVFASKIDNLDAPKLYAYIANNYSKTQYVGVEKALYLKDQFKKLPDTKASFDYTLGGKTYKSELSDGRSEVIKIPSVNINQLKVSNVTGKISVLSLYTSSYTENVKNDPSITMTRKYYDAATGKEATSFKANDLVKVEISYNVEDSAIDNTYEISDYAPAGLKPLDNPWNYDLKESGWWYRQMDVQKVTFVVGKNQKGVDKKPLVYYARVAGPGEYVAEGTVAQGSIVKSSIVTNKNDKIIIKP